MENITDEEIKQIESHIRMLKEKFPDDMVYPLDRKPFRLLDGLEGSLTDFWKEV